MKRTEIFDLPNVPSEIAAVFHGARVFDSSCSPEARVYFIDKNEGLYLKTAAKGSLLREAQMGGYFYKKGLAPRILSYVSEERDFLVTARAEGEDATHESFLSDPKRLASVMGEALRALHEMRAEDCPVQDRMGEYLALADRNFSEGKFDLSLFGDRILFESAEEAYKALCEGRRLLRNEVLLHGDYCLPNIMLKDFKITSFIDVGNGGIGDRHVDLFWGAWTLWFNLKTDAYRDRFFDAYGRDLVDEERLRVIAAAEIFG